MRRWLRVEPVLEGFRGGDVWLDGRFELLMTGEWKLWETCVRDSNARRYDIRGTKDLNL